MSKGRQTDEYRRVDSLYSQTLLSIEITRKRIQEIQTRLSPEGGGLEMSPLEVSKMASAISSLTGSVKREADTLRTLGTMLEENE